jgi:hypothetical protein
MFDSTIIPSALAITGYRKLRRAVSAGTVTPEDALRAVEAIAAKRGGEPTGKLAIVLAQLRAGEWKKAEPKAASPEPKAEPKAKAAPKAKAESPEPAPAPTPEDDLVGMKWNALRALGKSLGVAGRRRDVLTERIRAARAAKADVAEKAKPRKAKAATAAKPAMPSPEVLRGAVDALTAWLAHQ